MIEKGVTDYDVSCRPLNLYLICSLFFLRGVSGVMEKYKIYSKRSKIDQV